MNKNLDIQCTSGYCLIRSEIQENAVSSVTGYFHKFKPEFLSNVKFSECVLLKIHEPDNKFSRPCLFTDRASSCIHFPS